MVILLILEVSLIILEVPLIILEALGFLSKEIL